MRTRGEPARMHAERGSPLAAVHPAAAPLGRAPTVLMSAVVVAEPHSSKTVTLTVMRWCTIGEKSCAGESAAVIAIASGKVEAKSEATVFFIFFLSAATAVAVAALLLFF